MGSRYFNAGNGNGVTVTATHFFGIFALLCNGNGNGVIGNGNGNAPILRSNGNAVTSNAENSEVTVTEITVTTQKVTPTHPYREP